VIFPFFVLGILPAAMYIALSLLFFVGSFALIPPGQPDRGYYEYEIRFAGEPENEYIGGALTYDYLSGFIRLDSYNSSDPNPGINGVTIWDLRDVVPEVTTIDSLAKCYIQNIVQTMPLPLDFSGLSFAGYLYWNRALAEKWVDRFGGTYYFDSFTRDVVGITNSSVDNQFEYNIHQWSTKKPDGSAFFAPEAVNCIRLNNTFEYERIIMALEAERDAIEDEEERAQFDIKCKACTIGIDLIKGRICTVAGAAACAPFPPSVPFCSTIATLLCKAIPVSSEQVCKIIRLC